VSTGTQPIKVTAGPSQVPLTEDPKWRFRWFRNSDSKAAGVAPPRRLCLVAPRACVWGCRTGAGPTREAYRCGGYSQCGFLAWRTRSKRECTGFLGVNELASNGLEWIPRRAIRRARAPSDVDVQLPNRCASETKQLFPASRQPFLHVSGCHLWARCVLASSSPCNAHSKKIAGELRDSPASSFSERRRLRPSRFPPTQLEARAWSAQHRESSIVVIGQVCDRS
jgi:hypothetical protein